MDSKHKNFVVAGVSISVIAAICLSVLLPVRQQAAKVQTVKAVKAESSSKNSFSGKLEALETANVVSKISGKVGEIHVNIGSEVRPGSTLLTLEADELAASVAQARANVEVARSSLETARLDYAVQKANLERNRALVEQGALARADYENKYELPFAKAKETVLNGSTAQVRQAEASLQLAKANYQNSIIVSPISGVVTAKNINIGELASPEITLFSVVNIDKVFVMTSIGEDMINQIVLGGQLPIKIAAVSPDPFTGTVTNIAQASGGTLKTYLVKVLIDNPKHLLKPGMFAEVLWSVKLAEKVIVPKTAIVSQNGRNYVWLLKEGIAFRQEVVVDNLDVINATISYGLTDEDDVVISGQETLNEGVCVRK